MAEEGGRTLNEMYMDAVKTYGAIEQSSADGADPKKQELVAQCRKQLEELWRCVGAAKVFSANEEIDDMATGDIKFFLVLYYLGDIFERVVDTSRAANLRHATRLFQFFMKLCLDYSMISEKEHESLITPINPTDRAARIERLKTQKELQAKLAELAEKKKQISRGITGDEGKSKQADEETKDCEFDAVERKYWLLTVEDRLRAASQQMHMSVREAEMLESLTAEQKDEASAAYQKAIQDSKGRPPDPSAMQRIESAPGPMIFTELNMDRERLLAEVFMDRNPATMSDAEYARIQMEKMVKQDDPKDKSDSDSEDEEVHNKKQLKASKWDDWKDDHARDGNMGANIG